MQNAVIKKDSNMPNSVLEIECLLGYLLSSGEKRQYTTCLDDEWLPYNAVEFFECHGK